MTATTISPRTRTPSTRTATSTAVASRPIDANRPSRGFTARRPPGGRPAAPPTRRATGGGPDRRRGRPPARAASPAGRAAPLSPRPRCRPASAARPRPADRHASAVDRSRGRARGGERQWRNLRSDVGSQHGAHRLRPELREHGTDRSRARGPAGGGVRRLAACAHGRRRLLSVASRERRIGPWRDCEGLDGRPGRARTCAARSRARGRGWRPARDSLD